MRSLRQYQTVIKGRTVHAVPVVIGDAKVYPQVTPNMAADAHVIITRPEVVAPGLRLGDWSQVGETNATAIMRPDGTTAEIVPDWNKSVLDDYELPDGWGMVRMFHDAEVRS